MLREMIFSGIFEKFSGLHLWRGTTKATPCCRRGDTNFFLIDANVCVIPHKGGSPRAWCLLKGRQTWKGRLPLDRGKARRVRQLNCSAHAVRFVYHTAWLAQGKTIWKQSEATLAELDLAERQDGGIPESSGSIRTKELLKGTKIL